MKKTILTFILLAAGLAKAFAQPATININTDYIEYKPGDVFPDANDIRIVNTKLTSYDPALRNKGLHFSNLVTNVMTHDFTMSNLFSSPVIGVHGKGTVFHLKGTLNANGGESRAAVMLTDGGHFLVDKNANLNLILEGSFYTRQMWMFGDGTGTFELEEGYVADKTQDGTVANGTGSLRFQDITIRTHSSESLPVYKRGDNTNSHLVIDGGKLSKWVVATNNQLFNGGLWLENGDLTLETQKDLDISGRQAISNAGGYRFLNPGGLMMMATCGDKQPRTLYKRGLASLILSGDNGFDPGSLIDIQEGKVLFKTDPLTDSTNAGYYVKFDCDKTSTSRAANLKVSVANDATLAFDTPIVRIDSIGLAPNATLQVNLDTKITTRRATFGGTLEIMIPDNKTIKQGDVFQIFQPEFRTQDFKTVKINDFGGSIKWNTSKLGTEGKLTVESGNITTRVSSNISTSIIKVYPVPFADILTVTTNSPETWQLILTDMTGKTVLQQLINENSQTINTSQLANGVYLYQILGKAGLIKTGKVVRVK